MKTQNLKAVQDAVNIVENNLVGFRTEHYLGAHQAAQMAFKNVVQTLAENGWIERDDADLLIQEQDSKWLKQWNYTPLGDGTVTNVDGKTGFEEYT